MKNIIVITAIGLGACLVAPSRSKPEQTSPTLAETLAFITATLGEQGAVPLKSKDSSDRMLDQQVIALDECVWRYRFRLETKQPLLGDGSVAVDLPLRKLDIKTLVVRTRSEGLTVYELAIEKPAAEKTSDTEALWAIGTLKDRETADRVARAYVHGFVLCSKTSAF